MSVEKIVKRFDRLDRVKTLQCKRNAFLDDVKTYALCSYTAA